MTTFAGPYKTVFMASSEQEPMQINWQALTIGVLLALGVAAYMGYGYFRKLVLPNVPDKLAEEFLYIPTGTDYQGLVDTLVNHHFILNREDFEWVARKMSFDKRPVRSGRFKIQPGWTNRQLITHLRAGKQAPVKLILTDERYIKDIARKAARYIEPDKQWLLDFLSSPDSLRPFGLTPENVLTIFIPNTYEVYWNYTPADLVRRMIKEKKRFWSKNHRLEKAKALGMTPDEVYTLASIVERETNYNPEKPTIASVYLNRLRKGIKLQADPTCVFASGDYHATRVTKYHLSFKSPYNTYLHEGLPPGPISMASAASIDAVLNPDTTDYIFFCARPDNTGRHAFARTLRGHNVNVKRFRQYMAQREIERALAQAAKTDSIRQMAN